MGATILVERGMALRSTLIEDEREIRAAETLDQFLQLACRDEFTLRDDCTLANHLEQLGEEVLRLAMKMTDSEVVKECTGHILGQIGLTGACADDDWPFLEDLLKAVCSQVENTYDRVDGRLSIEVDAMIGGNAKNRVRASTRFPNEDAPDRRRASIYLQLPETFSARDYFALLRMIHHEVFVHVVQTPTFSGQRTAVGDDCPLAEGMLDHVAHHLLLREIGPHLGERLSRWETTFVNRASELHAERFQTPTREASFNEKLAHEARTLGRAVVQRIEKVRQEAGTIQWVEDVSMRLNLAPLVPAQRLAAMHILRSGINAPDKELSEFLKVLSSIRAGGDVEKLLRL